jgi:hypothetical protein
MKTVLETVLRRVDLSAAGALPEKPRVHHVTRVPAGGGRVIATAR